MNPPQLLSGVAAVVILLAVLFGAWGFEDWRGFLAHPARLGVLVVFLARLAFGFVVRVPTGPRPRELPQRLPERAFFSWLVLAFLLVLVSPAAERRGWFVLPVGDGWRFAGLAMVAAGVALATWAQCHLARTFSGFLAIQPDHRLVTDGPFARVRHPRYAGLMLVLIGLPLVFRSGAGLAGGVLGCALFLGRTFREERMLAAAFGERWAAYVRRTRRLVPGVY